MRAAWLLKSPPRGRTVPALQLLRWPSGLHQAASQDALLEAELHQRRRILLDEQLDGVEVRASSKIPSARRKSEEVCEICTALRTPATAHSGLSLPCAGLRAISRVRAVGKLESRDDEGLPSSPEPM